MARLLLSIYHELFVVKGGDYVTSRKRGKRPLDAVTEALTKAANTLRDAPAGGTSVNVTRRTNVQVATNVGQDGEGAYASATQVAPITQTGDTAPGSGTDEEHTRK